METVSGELAHREKWVICELCGGKHRTAYHKSSNGHKFPAEIRHQARELAGNLCAICGKSDSFDVHHFLAIWAYKALTTEQEYETLDKSVLTSLHNALVVCEECHDDLHYLDGKAIGDAAKEEKRLEYYRWAAQSLLSLFYGSE